MKILRNQLKNKSQIIECQYCYSILEVDSSDINVDYCYSWVRCPVCFKQTGINLRPSESQSKDKTCPTCEGCSKECSER